MMRSAPTYLLSVRGRRSRWHTTPVAVLEHDGERYFISYRGASDWARNLEVSHSARLIRHGSVEEIRVVDVPVDDRGALLSASAETSVQDDDRIMTTHSDDPSVGVVPGTVGRTRSRHPGIPTTRRTAEDRERGPDRTHARIAA